MLVAIPALTHGETVELEYNHTGDGQTWERRAGRVESFGPATITLFDTTRNAYRSFSRAKLRNLRRPGGDFIVLTNPPA